MFGIGIPEMLLILAVALIVVGPQKLPDIAKYLGKAIGEFRKAASELKESVGIDTEMRNVRKAFDEMNSDLKKAVEMKPDSASENQGKDMKPLSESHPADIAVKEGRSGESASDSASKEMLSEKRKNEEKS